MSRKRLFDELNRPRNLSQSQLSCRLEYLYPAAGRRRVPVSLLPQIAETLAVSLEELIGKKDVQPAKRGPAPKLQQQIERIQRLPRAKQRFVIEMLDTVLAQASR
jgi:hypothetical protein